MIIVSGGSDRKVSAKTAPWPGGTQRLLGPTRGLIQLYGGRAATYEAMVFSQPWVYAAVRAFWLAFIALTCKAYSGEGSEDRTRERTHPLALNLRSPWDGASGVDAQGELALNLFTHGNHLELVAENKASRAGFDRLPIPWGIVQEVTDSRGTIGYNVWIDGQTYPLLPSDVIRYKLMGGKSPLEPLRRTLNIEDAAMDWQVSALDNGPSLRGAFTTEKQLQDKTLPRLRAELEALYAGPNGKSIGLFDQGISFESISQSATDVGIVEQRRLSREEVAAAFGIPAPVIGILDHATYSNVTELVRFFYKSCVHPYLKLIEETLQVQLIDRRPAWDGLFVEFDMHELLRPDPEAEARTMLMSQQSGTTSTNERRKMMNYPPVAAPGLKVDDPENPFNLPLQPVNMTIPGQQPPALAAGSTDSSTATALVLEAMRGGARQEVAQE